MNINDPLEEHLTNILINLIDYILIDEDKTEPDIKKHKDTHCEQLIDLLFKSFLFQPFFNGLSGFSKRIS